MSEPTTTSDSFKRLAIALLAALALLAAACGSDSSSEPAAEPTPTEADEPSEGEEQSAGEAESDDQAEAAEVDPTEAPAEPAVEEEEESETPVVPDPPEGWPLPNLDPSSTRAVFGSAIDSSTVDALELAWTYPLDIGTRATSTPIVIDGVVYIGDLNTNVHAIDLATGEGIWRADGGIPTFGPGGVVVEDGLVFASYLGAEVAAFDAASGEKVWATNITGEVNGGFVLIQPTVADGLVLAATSPNQSPGTRGTLFGLDQKTGEIEWAFDTIESPDLWGNPEINSGGGSWFPPAVDLDNGISYWGTSNPSPFPGTEGFPNGTSRPGDNKWTDSMVAIDNTTGELVWGNQAIAHDIFDRDAVVVAIADLPDGERVLIHTGKLGRVRGLTEAGEVIWDTPVGLHQNDDLESFEGPLDVLPGGVGGVTAPVGVADGVIYTSVINAPILYEGPEQKATGFATRFGEFDSQFYAIDAATGEILWEVDLPGDSIGGATVVNDLVFTTMLEPGVIMALDRETGEQVWSMDLPGQVDGWPAILDDQILLPVGGYNAGSVIAIKLADQ